MTISTIKIEKVLIDGNYKKYYHIHIDQNKYKVCIKASMNMWSSEKKGCKYNEGMLNTKKDPYRTERIGRLGEMAFGILVEQPIDDTYIKYGDKMDFLYKGKKINVKCSTKYNKNEICFVRGIDSFGKKIELIQDIYVFSYLKNEDSKKEIANVVIMGYQTKEFIENKKLIKSTLDDHYNYVLSYSELLDISNII